MEYLRMWIDEIFNQNPELIRIGLTTWSGNNRMMNLAEKLSQWTYPLIQPKLLTKASETIFKVKG